MTAEDAARAHAWITYWLQGEPIDYAGEDLAPILEWLQGQITIQTYYETIGMEPISSTDNPSYGF